MKVDPKLPAAIKRIANKTEFSERHGIPIRTLYNLLEPNRSANRSTQLVVRLALVAEGLIKPEAPAKKQARKKAAA